MPAFQPSRDATDIRAPDQRRFGEPRAEPVWRGLAQVRDTFRLAIGCQKVGGGPLAVHDYIVQAVTCGDGAPHLEKAA